MKVSAAERRKAFFQKYRCALIVPAYGAIYLSWFSYLERTVVQPEHIVHLWLDDLIPFLEVFIVPYMLWFAYVAAVCIFLLAKDRGEFLRNFIFLAIGMTIFLIVSTVYPNGQTLRPASFERQNIFTDMVASLYRTDSPNNVLPSIRDVVCRAQQPLPEESPDCPVRLAGPDRAHHPVHHVHQAALRDRCVLRLRHGLRPLPGVLLPGLLRLLSEMAALPGREAPPGPCGAEA